MIDAHFILGFKILPCSDLLDKFILVTSTLILDHCEVRFEIIKQFAELIFFLNCILQDIWDTWKGSFKLILLIDYML